MPYLQLPSGQYLEIPKGMNPQEAIAKAQEQFPVAFLTPGKKEERQGLDRKSVV